MRPIYDYSAAYDEPDDPEPTDARQDALCDDE